MKLKVEITQLENRGDAVRVTGQGSGPRDAAWRPLRLVSFDVKESEARRMRVGGTLVVSIRAQGEA